MEQGAYKLRGDYNTIVASSGLATGQPGSNVLGGQIKQLMAEIDGGGKISQPMAQNYGVTGGVQARNV